MFNKKYIALIVFSLTVALLLAACQSEPETVEVTRVVETEGETVVETVVEEIEVTRVVEVEGETVVETVVEEVTRVVETEVIVDPTECNLDAPAEEVELNMMGWLGLKISPLMRAYWPRQMRKSRYD